MRGLDGILSPQKYSLAVLAAGTAMLPVGWKRILFPSFFWAGMLYNWKTVLQSAKLTHHHGLDGAAAIQRLENLPSIGST